LEVVGRLYNKELKTSRRILIERNCKFPRNSLNGKEIASCRRVKIITNLTKSFASLF
jgi:hypothetical protein